MSPAVLSLLVGSVTLCQAAILYEVDFGGAGNITIPAVPEARSALLALAGLLPVLPRRRSLRS